MKTTTYFNWKTGLMVFTLFILLTAVLLSMQSLRKARAAASYTTSGNHILKNGVPWEGRGVNSMNVWFPNGGSSIASMDSWGIDIVRQTVDMKISTLNEMQNAVNDARAHNKVTILTAMSYDNKDVGGTTPYPNFQLLGANPSQDPRWNAVLTRWREIAQQFKNQPDVWLDVWNEPYWYNDAHGYSDSMWLSDMQTLVDTIRSTGANNIVLVPGSKTGQGENVIATRGPALLAGRRNIVFELHAYEDWLQDSKASVESRIQNVLNANVPLLFGEYGAHNSGDPEQMDVANFLAAVSDKHVSALAWLWKQESNDKNALLDDGGNPHNDGNLNYGSKVKSYTSAARNPLVSSGYEAENAALTGGAKANSNHTGYSGNSFVDGYWNVGATTTFTVNVPSSKQFAVTLHYGNNMGDTRSVNVYVNGTFVKTTYLANLSNWNSWGDQTETLNLHEGTNTISYKYDSSNSGNINLDYITVR